MVPLASADEEVVGFDVSVEEMSGVYVLDSLDHLVGQHEHGLEGEFTAAHVEEIL